MRSKRIIDWIILILLVCTAFSGINLHIIGHANQAIDHNRFIWSWIHGVVALAFIVLVLIHVIQHLSWYKNLTNKAKNKKVKVRRIAVLTLDSILFLLLISGLWLLFFPVGDFTKLGIAHYAIGLALIVFVIGHIAKRIKLLIG